MKAWLALPLLAVAAFGQEAPQPDQQPPAPQHPQQPIRVKYVMWGDDGRTLVADIHCEEASVKENDRTSFSGEVRDCEVAYYTQPSSRQTVSQKVILQAGAGTVDGKKKTFGLRENVVVRMNEPAADGSPVETRIETASLFVDWPMQQLTTDQFVSLKRQNALIQGRGLEADDTLRQITILRNGSMEIIGAPRDVMGAPAARREGQPLITRLRSTGPLAIRYLGVEIPGERRFVSISARDGVEIEREEDGRTLKATADSATIYVARTRDAAGVEGIEPVSMTLRGAITMVDGQGAHAKAASADWTVDDDLMKLTGAPRVEFSQRGQKVLARSAVIDRWAGTVAFRRDIEAVLALDGRALNLQARELSIGTESLGGQPQPAFVLAEGDVTVKGDAGAAGPIDASGTRFSWNAIEGRGVLSGEPFAHVTQGGSRIDAPEVAFEGRNSFVVKGPKRLRFVQAPRPDAKPLPGRDAAKPMDVEVRSDGDVSYDGGTGRVSMTGRCEVRWDGSRLAADRLFLRLAPDGSGIEDVTGFGDVRIEHSGMKFLADSFRYLPPAQVIEIRGEPQVVATMGLGENRSTMVRIDQANNRIELYSGDMPSRLVQFPKK